MIISLQHLQVTFIASSSLYIYKLFSKVYKVICSNHFFIDSIINGCGLQNIVFKTIIPYLYPVWSVSAKFFFTQTIYLYGELRSKVSVTEFLSNLNIGTNSNSKVVWRPWTLIQEFCPKLNIGSLIIAVFSGIFY